VIVSLIQLVAAVGSYYATEPRGAIRKISTGRNRPHITQLVDKHLHAQILVFNTCTRVPTRTRALPAG
jgi:hypothetical protein